MRALILVMMGNVLAAGAWGQSWVLFASPGEKFRQAEQAVAGSLERSGGAAVKVGKGLETSAGEVKDAAGALAGAVGRAAGEMRKAAVEVRERAGAIAGIAVRTAPDPEWLAEGARRAADGVHRLNKPEARWKASLLMLIASSVVDAHSSWNKAEANGVLANSDGRFGGRAVAMKVGLTGTAVAVQWWLVKKNPRPARYFAIANAGLAVTHAAVAAYNYGNAVAPATVKLPMGR